VSNDELLNHPEVLKVIRLELLRGGYPRHDIDDGVRDVVAEVFEYVRGLDEPIESVDRMKAIVRPRAFQRGVDGMRAKVTRDEHIAPAPADAAVNGTPAPSLEAHLEMKEAVAIIAQNQEPHDAPILQGLVDGLSQKEIAERIEKSHDHVRKHTGGMRGRYRELLRRRGFKTGVVAGIAGVLAVVVAWFVFHGHFGPDDEAHRVPPPQPSQTVAPPTPPTPPPQVPVATNPTPQERAADLRAKALDACRKSDWQTCRDLLDDASGLDPAGAQDPKLQAAHKQAEDGLLEQIRQLEAKPRIH